MSSAIQTISWVQNAAWDRSVSFGDRKRKGPTTLLVPYNCYWKYQETDYWYKFSHIEEMDEVSGDVNGDGNINISDVTNLIDLLLSGDELPAYADVNGDGGVNIKDVTDLIDILLSGN